MKTKKAPSPRIEITNSDLLWHINLVGHNGRVTLSSETLTSKRNALKNIASSLKILATAPIILVDKETGEWEQAPCE